MRVRLLYLLVSQVYTNRNVKKQTKYESIYESIDLDELTLRNLKGNAGLSKLTLKFRKERDRLMGSESKTAKLIDLKINKKEDYVTFIFLTEPTEKKYPSDYKFKQVDPTTKKIKNNPSKTYEIQIRILDFFKWLYTTPDPDNITNQDIEDVLKIANVQVWSNDPSFFYQGLAYYLHTVFDATIYPATIPPTDTVNKNGNIIGWKSRHGDGQGLSSKHLQGIINNVEYYFNQMRMMLKKRLGLTKK